MAAGGGFVTRELHSGRDEVIFHAQHPIIWNGVPDLANPADLSDPALNVTLAPIAPEARRTERELFADVEAARPAILGALRDAVSSALRNRKTVAVERVERRAEFGMWVAAAEPGLGWEPGNFMAAHRANRAGAVERTVESDPVASAVVKLAERVMLPWEGSASELLAELDQEVKEKSARRGFGLARRRSSPTACAARRRTCARSASKSSSVTAPQAPSPAIPPPPAAPASTPRG